MMLNCVSDCMSFSPLPCQYWVSQGNKWCDFCKIFISNNPTSIRNHELGQRHKDSVAKRLVTMRQEKASKEKEQKEAARALEQIETKAKRSYEKDISAFKDARVSNANAFVAQEDDQGTVNAEEDFLLKMNFTKRGPAGTLDVGVILRQHPESLLDWEYDSSSGYYCHKTNGCFYDPNSGFYYTDALGRWVTREEAFAAAQTSSKAAPKKPIFKKPSAGSESRSVSENKGGTQSQNGAAATGLVVSAPLNPTRTVKGAPSSLTLNKRKRQDGKPKILSEEEKAAIKAREAARKRVEEREKPLLGLYRQ
ncbi:hypothetical protein RHSIM_Rhsim11G0168500 [Rhododendron simsii]|uniref:Matrin-type domain-containing protein n=1 Tax=Rhododendron simsii TaxID=118357 RepID=A0A834GBK1_RHOSS|nr:hypothetical protein RHSIM_Rhsim11G0168500 [Rhododendron simsii]